MLHLPRLTKQSESLQQATKSKNISKKKYYSGVFGSGEGVTVLPEQTTQDQTEFVKVIIVEYFDGFFFLSYRQKVLDLFPSKFS